MVEGDLHETRIEIELDINKNGRHNEILIKSLGDRFDFQSLID